MNESEYQTSAMTWTPTKNSTRTICNALFISTKATTKVHIIEMTKITLVKARYFLHMTRHWAFGPIRKNVETRRNTLHKVYGIANFAGEPASLINEMIEITANRIAIPIHPNHPRILCLYVSCVKYIVVLLVLCIGFRRRGVYVFVCVCIRNGKKCYIVVEVSVRESSYCVYISLYSKTTRILDTISTIQKKKTYTRTQCI